MPVQISAFSRGRQQKQGSVRQPPASPAADTAQERIAYVIPPPALVRAAEGGRPLMRPATADPPVPVATIAAPADATAGQPYQVAAVGPNSRPPEDIYEPRREAELRTLVAEVVSAEAPLSLSLLVKRVAPFYGIARTSPRITARLQAVVDGSAKQRGQMLWRLDQDPSTYPGFRVAGADARRDPSEIAVEEIANAAAFALRTNVAMPYDDLVKQTARTLGFGRTGERVAERMGEGIQLLVASGRARREGERIATVHV